MSKRRKWYKPRFEVGFEWTFGAAVHIEWRLAALLVGPAIFQLDWSY